MGTDPASIKYLDENELLERAEDPEKYYIEVIMQEKIRLYLQYVEKQSFLYDIALIFKTFRMIVNRNPNKSIKRKLLHTLGLNVDCFLTFSPKVCIFLCRFANYCYFCTI